MCGDVHVEATSAVLREVSGGRFFAEARLRPAGYDAPAFARSACLAEAGSACEGWWSQAGSNRRPRHCERRALPAELWPRRDRPGRRPTIGAIYLPRPCQVKNGEIAVFRVIYRELPLFAGS